MGSCFDIIIIIIICLHTSLQLSLSVLSFLVPPTGDIFQQLLTASQYHETAADWPYINSVLSLSLSLSLCVCVCVCVSYHPRSQGWSPTNTQRTQVSHHNAGICHHISPLHLTIHYSQCLITELPTPYTVPDYSTRLNQSVARPKPQDLIAFIACKLSTQVLIQYAATFLSTSSQLLKLWFTNNARQYLITTACYLITIHNISSSQWVSNSLSLTPNTDTIIITHYGTIPRKHHTLLYPDHTPSTST